MTRYTGRDLGRDTYEGIDMGWIGEPRRTVVAPQPAQPVAMEVQAEHYAANAVRSFAKRNGRAPTERETERIARNAASLVEAMYPRRERDA